MIVAIHQPSYFPWLGLLNKIAKADIFIVMDEVQLADRAYQHRNIFLDSSGNFKYLTIPIIKKGYRKKVIKEIEINDTVDWEKKHARFLFLNYKKHQFFTEIYPTVGEFYKEKYKFLMEAVWKSMKMMIDFLDIKTEIVFQSQLSYDRSKKKGDLILELVKAVNGNIYLSGVGAKEYMEKVLDRAKNMEIKVLWNNFYHFKYPQRNSKQFVEGLSSLDFLFNVGINEGRIIFWKHVLEEKKKLLEGF